ncbi:hypothetical protein [Actinopolymorpha alba]|uniref:hypothetical protein n=1 Tax=Actinopolymorpha alba TaxID=533267 RepID=UPI003B50835C
MTSGLSDEFLEAQLRAGRWQRVHRGIYVAHRGPLSRKTAVWAAILYAGPGAAASHHTAAELWGIAPELDVTIHVAVPSNRRPPGQRLHRQGIRHSAVRLERRRTQYLRRCG